MSTPGPAPESDDALPLPAPLEERVYDVLFDTAGEDRRRQLDALIADNPEHAAAIRDCARVLTAGDAAMGMLLAPLVDVPLPRCIGGYHILELLGEGGFGAVYRAEQREPVCRLVALKVLHVGRSESRAEWRFHAERQALARMQHANIAQIYDAGRTDEGRPFFAMEFVDGQPITRWCDERAATVEQRLELFLRVCAAIQHAHQRSIVHRDLKPSNVLVRDGDEGPEPKVIDFGVAKMLTADEAVEVTLDGALIGTPAYMSPEQAAGQAIDTRTDVYALGLLLYELLTGALPFPAELLAGGLARATEVIRDHEPRRMISALRAAGDEAALVAARRSCTEVELARRIGGDLEWIVRRAMAKSPERRYATANELIADVERHLGNLPVSARQRETLYVLGRFFARHRLGVVAALLLLLATAGVIFSLVILLGRVEQARQVAVERGDTAMRDEYAAHLAAARAALATGDIAGLRHQLGSAAVQFRGWEWDYLHAFCDASRAVLQSEIGRFRQVAWLDAERVCCIDGDGELTVWHPASGEVESVPIRLPGFVAWCWTDDRSRMFAIVDHHTHVVAIDVPGWRVTTLYRNNDPMPGLGDFVRALVPEQKGEGIDLGELARAIKPPRRVRGMDLRSLAVSPDAQWVAVSDNAGVVRLLPTRGRGPVRSLGTTSFFAWQLCFTPDGERLFAGTGDGHVICWSVRDGSEVFDVTIHPEGATSLALDLEHQRLFVGAGRSLWSLNAATGSMLQRVRVPVAPADLAFDVGTRTLYGASDSSVVAWDGATLEELGRFYGHESATGHLVLDPGGRRFASCCRESARVFDRTPLPSARLCEAGFDAKGLDTSPDGAAVAVVTSEGWLRVWDLDTLEQQLELRLSGYLADCAFGDDSIYAAGSRLAAIDRGSGRVRLEREAPAPLGRCVVDPEGRWLLAGEYGGERVFCFELPTLELVHASTVGKVVELGYDVDRRAFMACVDAASPCWLTPTAEGLRIERSATAPGAAVASRAGLLVVSGERAIEQRESLGDFGTLAATSGTALAIDSGLRRIAVGGDDGRVRLLDRTGREVLVLGDSPRRVAELAFAAGDTRLVALGNGNGMHCFVVVWSLGG